jgi:hypothetical protein
MMKMNDNTELLMLQQENRELRALVIALQEENRQLALMLEPISQSLPNIMPKITWD